MNILPDKIYSPIKSLKDKYPKLSVIVVLIVLLLLSLSIIIYFKSLKLTKNEIIINPLTSEYLPEYYEGKVMYIGDSGDGITYSLADGDGKEVLLLKSTDAKLKIVEGLHVRVYGELIKSLNENEKDILLVKEVILQNATN